MITYSTQLTMSNIDCVGGGGPHEVAYVIGALKEEIVELKADVERLEKQRDTEREMHAEFNKWVVELIDKNVAELKAENDKLQEECDRRVGAEDYDEAVEHSVKLQNVWIELYARDKDGCDVDWKTIASITDYDEEKAKKLYEAEYPDLIEDIAELQAEELIGVHPRCHDRNFLSAEWCQ